MTHIEIQLNYTDSYFQLKSIYSEIEKQIMEKEGRINIENYQFNNYIGDITKNINWTWAINQKSIQLFMYILEQFQEDINNFFENKFNLIGASFITLFEKEVKDTDFHYDINSHYDNEKCNTITLIFPLYIEEDMGNLEYKENAETKIYEYQKNKVLVWDACKFEHRTQPYILSEKKKRVLVSMNLSTEEEWAEKSVVNSLQYQGNIIL